MSLFRVIYYGALVATLFAVGSIFNPAINTAMVAGFNALYWAVGMIKALDQIFPVVVLLEDTTIVITLWTASILMGLALGSYKLTTSPSTSTDSA